MEKVECILKYKLLITKVYRIVENFEKDDLRVIRQELALAMMEERLRAFLQKNILFDRQFVTFVEIRLN